MDALFAWLSQNWFSLLQSVAIVAGLLFTAISIRRETRNRKVGDLLTLAERHRELWSEVHRLPELQRVMSEEADLVANPITTAEREFLNLAFVHFNIGWQLAGANTFLSLEALSLDAKRFFSLPLPRSVWNSARQTRDPKFVNFIESSLKSHPAE